MVGLDLDLLAKRHICSDHFSVSDYISDNKKRLKKDAVPKSWKNRSPSPQLRVMIPTKTYIKGHTTLFSHEMPSTSTQTLNSPISSPTSSNFIKNIIDFPTPPSKNQIVKKCTDDLFDTPRKKKLKATIHHQSILLKNKRSLLSKYRKSITNARLALKHEQFLNSLTYNSSATATFVKMQILHQKYKRWTLKEKKFSLQLFYKSPSTYKFLRVNLKLVLPSISVIRKWIGNSKFNPGFSPKHFNDIKIKVETMSEKEKCCTVVFDEMRIKSYLEYNQSLDRVEGFEDLGFLGRKNLIGQQAMVFCARGLYSSWKMPLGYFITHSSMKSNDLKTVIIDCIEKLFDIGLNVCAVVSDQGTNNQSAYKMLGMTSEKPYFYVRYKQIFSVYDVPHIFKNIRNNWLTNDILFKNHKVSFSDVRAVYNIDKQNTSRCLLKLTDAHLNPNAFQKMKCKLALQIFSHSVSATIKTCVQTGQLKSESAIYTSEFVETLNNLFDCLNSKSLYNKNPFQSALTDDNKIPYETLINAKIWSESLFKITNKGSTKPHSFNGLTWSINAILGLYEKQKNLDYTYILTARLNSDVIENLFASYRQRGGYNRNPTVRTFRTTFQLNSKMNLIKPSTISNCEPDSDINLLATVNEPISQSENIISETENSDDDDSIILNEPHLITEKPLEISVNRKITLQDCSEMYFAGYLVKKLLEKFNCDNCSKSLQMCETDDINDPRQLLILNKTYSQNNTVTKLKKPSPQITDFVSKSLIILQNKIDKKPHTIKIKAKILEEIKQTLFKNLLTNNYSCESHLIFLTTHLVHCKLFRFFNLQSKNIKSDRSKIVSKLNILQNV